MLTFTANGLIEVYFEGVLVSRHRAEREATESILRHDGEGEYEIVYPKVRVRKKRPVIRYISVETGRGYGIGMAVEVVRRVVDATAPTVGSMTASGMTATQVTLAWPSVSDVDFSYFELQKSTDGINFGFLTTKITTSHTDTGLTAGSAYSYRYRIVDQSGNRSAFSSVISPIFPVVPTGLTVTTFSQTTITLDWADNSHTVSGYRVYRSTDGTNFTLIASPATSTYTDSNLTAGTTYYYRVTALTAFGESGQTASFSQQTQAATGPDWIQSLPNIPFVRGTTGQTFNFYPTYLNTNNNVVVTVESGTLPAEIRIVSSPTPQLAYDGTGTGSISAQVSFRVASTPEADWVSRSTASGVFYSHNFTYRNAAKTIQIASTADLIDSMAQGGGNYLQRAQWDQSIKLSGNGSMRLNMPASSGYNDSSGLTFDWAGIGIKPGNAGFKSVVKHEFYFQFAYYADSVYRDFFYGDASGSANWGGKIAIIECADSSFDVGEVVIRRDARPGGYIHGYRLAATSEYFRNYYASLNDYIQYNFFDNSPGSGAPASVNAMQLRHGPNWNQRSESSPDADVVSSNAPRLVSNGWTVIEVYIRQPTSGFGGTCKVWMAPYGQAPTLVFGGMNGRIAPVGTVDGSNLYPAQIYTGAQLTNYHNENQGVQNWPTTDTFVAYDELIVSDNPINFPGGFSIPNPGTTTPSNYPATGSSEWF